MTHDRDIERLLDRWLADGPTQASDRVFDDAVARIGRQRQRPAWLLRRELPVSSPQNLGLASAFAVVAIVVIGLGLSRPSSGPGLQPIASSSPSATASRASSNQPSAAVTVLASGDGGSVVLEPGTYRYEDERPAVTFAVTERTTAGKFASPGFSLGLGSSRSSLEVVYGTTVVPARSGCLPRDAVTDGAAAADVVQDLRASRGLTVAEPEPVRIGGLAGWSVDLQVADDVAPACLSADAENFPLLASEGNLVAHVDRGAGLIRVHVLDDGAGGTVIVLVNRHGFGASLDARLAAARPILDTFTFDVAR